MMCSLVVQAEKGLVVPFGVTKIGVEKPQEERSLAADSGKKENGYVRLGAFHLGPHGAAGQVGEVVLEEDAEQVMPLEHDQGLGPGGGREHFIAGGFEQGLQDPQIFGLILDAEDSG